MAVSKFVYKFPSVHNRSRPECVDVGGSVVRPPPPLVPGGVMLKRRFALQGNRAFTSATSAPLASIADVVFVPSGVEYRNGKRVAVPSFKAISPFVVLRSRLTNRILLHVGVQCDAEFVSERHASARRHCDPNRRRVNVRFTLLVSFSKVWCHYSLSTVVERIFAATVTARTAW